MSRVPLAFGSLCESLCPSARWMPSFPPPTDSPANPAPSDLSMDITSSRKPFLAPPQGADSTLHLAHCMVTAWPPSLGNALDGDHIGPSTTGMSSSSTTWYKYHLQTGWTRAGVTGPQHHAQQRTSAHRHTCNVTPVLKRERFRCLRPKFRNTDSFNSNFCVHLKNF